MRGMYISQIAQLYGSVHLSFPKPVEKVSEFFRRGFYGPWKKYWIFENYAKTVNGPVLGTTVRERYKLRVLINHAEAGKAIA
eukprot:SAG11_NODE_51_length_19848_cov_37.780698_1_plen_82_part_00